MAVAEDLPDPLDKPAATPMSQSPDDLLSQMADDAIDKLIAEAETQAPVSKAPLAQPPAAEPEAAPEAAPADIPVDAPAEPSLQSVLSAADSTPAAAEEMPADLEMSASVSDVENHTLAEPAINPELPGAPIPTPAQPAEISTSADVKALLAEADIAPLPGEKSSPLLWPLRVLSAPLTNVDDHIRNAIGQIAIVTLINAIAVLIYVLVVRHK